MKEAPTCPVGAPIAEITVPADCDSAPMSRADAQALTDSIRADLARAVDALSTAWSGLTVAYHSRAWESLGHTSWEAYCRHEFGPLGIKLSIADRRDLVASLRLEGMSLRAIASATGVDHATVHRDLAATGADAPIAGGAKPISGVNGKQYAAKSRAVRVVEQVRGGELPDGEVVDAEIVADDNAGPVPLPPAPPVSPAPKTNPRPISQKRPKRRAATTRKPRSPKPAGEIPLWEAVDGLHAALREQLLRRGVTAVTHRRADDLARTEITFIVTVATNGRADDPARWAVTVRGSAKAAESVRDRLREHADDFQTVARLLDDAISKAR